MKRIVIIISLLGILLIAHLGHILYHQTECITKPYERIQITNKLKSNLQDTTLVIQDTSSERI